MYKLRSPNDLDLIWKHFFWLATQHSKSGYLEKVDTHNILDSRKIEALCAISIYALKIIKGVEYEDESAWQGAFITIFSHVEKHIGPESAEKVYNWIYSLHYIRKKEVWNMVNWEYLLASALPIIYKRQEFIPFETTTIKSLMTLGENWRFNSKQLYNNLKSILAKDDQTSLEVQSLLWLNGMQVIQNDIAHWYSISHALSVSEVDKLLQWGNSVAEQFSNIPLTLPDISSYEPYI